MLRSRLTIRVLITIAIAVAAASTHADDRGSVVWEMTLDAASTGTLMTYLHNGKQFIVSAIGGADHPAEFIALSLP